METNTPVPCGRISPCALGGAFGILSAVAVLAIALLAHFVHYGVPWVKLVASLYLGFDTNPLGILIGVLWAFADGYIFGFVLAWLYNAIVKRCNCKNCHPQVQ